jgi:hypothetical protein
VDVDYFIRTKLMELSEDDAIRLLEEKLITEREGFFRLKSSKNLTHTEAFLSYRKKDLNEDIYLSEEQDRDQIIPGMD